MTAVTPGREEMLAELVALVALSGDPNVSSEAIGIRVRNQRQLYADMKQFLRLAAKPADEGVREATIEECAKIAEETLIGHTLTPGGLARQDEAESIAARIRALSTTGEPKR